MEKSNILSKKIEDKDDSADEKGMKKEKSNILENIKEVLINNKGDFEEKFNERSSVVMDKKVDHQSEEIVEDINGKSNTLKDNKAEEMKVRSERYENKTYRTNISRDKTVYHHKKQTNVDSYKKETHLSEVIGNSAKLKTLT